MIKLKFSIEIKKFFSTPKNFIFMVLGPLVFTIIFGLTYSNDYLNNIPMAILDMDNSGTSRSVVEKFENDSRYDVLYYPQSIYELERLMDDKKVSSGLFIPKNFQNDIKSKKGTEAALLVDGANIAIGNNGLATGTEILNTINAGITIKFIEGKDIPPVLAENYGKIFQFNNRTLWDSKLSYRYYVMPGIILVLVQQLFLSIFVLNFIRDRENLVEKSLVHIFIGMGAYFISAGTLKYFLGIDFKGSLLIATLMAGIYLTVLLGIAMTIGSFFRDRVKATQFCMMMSMPTFLTAGYVWPIFKMPPLLTGILKLFWPLIYMVSPLRDFLIKGQFPTGYSLLFSEMIVFGVVWFVIGNKFSKKTFVEAKEE